MYTTKNLNYWKCLNSIVYIIFAIYGSSELCVLYLQYRILLKKLIIIWRLQVLHKPENQTIINLQLYFFRIHFIPVPSQKYTMYYIWNSITWVIIKVYVYYEKCIVFKASSFHYVFYLPWLRFPFRITVL